MEIDGIKIPERFWDAPDEIKEKIVLRGKIKEELDQHPKKIYVIENQHTGEEKEINCIGTPTRIELWIRNFLVECDEDYIEDCITECKSRQKELHMNYIMKVSLLTRDINKEIKAFDKNKTVFDARGADIIDLAGKYYNHDDIMKVIVDEWGFMGTKMQALKEFTFNNLDTIEKKKQEYVNNNRDFRIATESGRLDILNEQLSYWIDRAKQKPGKNPTDIIVKLLEQARKEVKGNDLNLRVDGTIDINATLQGKENIIDISHKLPVNMIVIGLVAAQTNKNPLTIMNALATSYYAKNNGFNNAITGKEDINSPVNLIKSYDWDELRRKNEAITKQDSEIQEAQLIEEEKNDEAKKIMLAKLKKLKDR